MCVAVDAQSDRFIHHFACLFWHDELVQPSILLHQSAVADKAIHIPIHILLHNGREDTGRMLGFGKQVEKCNWTQLIPIACNGQEQRSIVLRPLVVLDSKRPLGALEACIAYPTRVFVHKYTSVACATTHAWRHLISICWREQEEEEEEEEEDDEEESAGREKRTSSAAASLAEMELRHYLNCS